MLDIDLSCSEWRARLLREQHERNIHFFRALAKKIRWSRARGKRSGGNGNHRPHLKKDVVKIHYTPTFDLEPFFVG